MLLEQAKHLKALCQAHGIAAYGIGDVDASQARLDLRRIMCAAPRTMTEYIVALHEIGHIVAEGGRAVRPSMVWSSEVIATRWALANSCAPVPADTIGFMAECLQSYDESKTIAECLTIIEGTD